MDDRKNILVLLCDQFRFDCIHALGNEKIKTPNIDRLVELGTSFENAYSTCPVCVAARYPVMSGCDPGTTGCFANDPPMGRDGLPEDMEERCGDYIARYMSAQGYRTFGIGKFLKSKIRMRMHKRFYTITQNMLISINFMGKEHICITYHR